MPLQYRQALPSDVPALSRLRATGWGTEEFWLSRVEGYMNGLSHPQQALPPRVLYVAQLDTTIVGFIAGHLTRRFGCQGELEWIDVDPEHRRAGIASALFHLLAAWFVEHEAVYICVDVDPDNARARSFYKRQGAEELNPHWMVWKDISGATPS